MKVSALESFASSLLCQHSSILSMGKVNIACLLSFDLLIGAIRFWDAKVVWVQSLALGDERCQIYKLLSAKRTCILNIITVVHAYVYRHFNVHFIKQINAK